MMEEEVCSRWGSVTWQRLEMGIVGGISVARERGHGFMAQRVLLAIQWRCHLSAEKTGQLQDFNMDRKKSIVAVLVCIPTNSVRGFPFLHTLSSIYCL